MNQPPQSTGVLSAQVPRKGGCSCCAMGCFSMFVVGLICLALLLGGTWWILGKVVDQFTSASPRSVQLEEPNEAQVAEATNKLQAVRDADRNGQSVTIQFTAADLNALIARHPDFEELRGKLRVAMEASVLTLDLSMPLTDVPLPRIKHRWFVGVARLGLAYNESGFNFALHSIEANDRTLPLNVLQRFTGIFSDSFNEGFEKSRSKSEHSHEFWENVKSLAVLDDKLVIITKGQAPDRTL